MRAILLGLALILAAPALAQSPAVQPVDPSVQSATPQNAAPASPPGAAPANGDADVQSAAPEVGDSRGGAAQGSGGNTQPPETTEPQRPTGGDGPAEPRVVEPAARTPAPALPTGVPFAARVRESAEELELQHALRGGVIGGAVSIPNQSAGILIQPDGRDWRQFRNQVLTLGGLVLLVLVILALAAFYLLSGTKRLESGRSGRKVARYTLAERVNHWMVAASFVILALTGLNITWGAYVLRPVIGPQAFTTLTYYGQAAHQYVAFAFIAGLLVMIVHWIRPNLPSRVDLAWIKAGGPFAKGHPPAGKFNAAQKALYFATMIGGIAVSVSGILLMAPFLLDNVILQQWSHIAHGLVAFGMIAMILGHAYIGSIGQEGAFEAMRDGEVDYNWAREHHSLWLEEELDRARRVVAPVPHGTTRPAGAD